LISTIAGQSSGVAGRIVMLRCLANRLFELSHQC
jgi:hypothetical protein